MLRAMSGMATTIRQTDGLQPSGVSYGLDLVVDYEGRIWFGKAVLTGKDRQTIRAPSRGLLRPTVAVLAIFVSTPSLQ